MAITLREAAMNTVTPAVMRSKTAAGRAAAMNEEPHSVFHQAHVTPGVVSGVLNRSRSDLRDRQACLQLVVCTSKNYKNRASHHLVPKGLHNPSFTGTNNQQKAYLPIVNIVLTSCEITT